MDVFFFQLAIIFLPGLIWERIVTKYALKRPPTPFEIGLRTFTFGLTCYLITFTIFNFVGIDVFIPEFKRDSSFIVDSQYVGEFIAAVEVSVFGAIIGLYIINYRFAARILNFLGATKKYGDEDVWDFAFSSPQPWSEYVYVRDYKNGKVMSGWVKAFSENEETREIWVAHQIRWTLSFQSRKERRLMPNPPSRPPSRGSTNSGINKGGTNPASSQVVSRPPAPPPSNPRPATPSAPRPPSTQR